MHDDRQASACDGKTPYQTWFEAAVAFKRRRRRTRRGALKTRTHVYRCRFCRRWHLGGSA